MKHLFMAVLVVLCAVTATPLSAEAPVTATLSLPHDHILPGVPFDMVVTYTNVSKRPITIASALATLVVTFEDGKTSVLHQAEGHDQYEIKSRLPLVLQPGESKVQAVSLEPMPNWFRYSSFAGPGTYRLALDLDVVDDDLDPVASIRTTTVALTRMTPFGLDAELWNRMQQVSEGHWASDSFRSIDVGAKLAEEIMQLYPASEYYPYALVISARSRARRPLATLLEAAGRFQSSPAWPYLLLASAESAQSQAEKAEVDRDFAAALKLAESAQARYRDALSTRSKGVEETATYALPSIKRLIERASKRAH
jgi:hypothetical protein